MKKLLVLGILLATVWVSSCASKAQKTLADYYEQHPGQSQLTPDKRVKARTARENRKRSEYYNSIQHR